MAITIKQIAAGQLTYGQSAYADLTPQVVSGKAQIIKTMRFYAAASIDLTVAVYSANTAPFSGTTAKIIYKNAALNGVAAEATLANEITLEAGQKLQYKTGGAGGPVDFVISGIERDV